MVTADETSPKNKHLRYGDNFATIRFCSHSSLLTGGWLERRGII